MRKFLINSLVFALICLTVIFAVGHVEIPSSYIIYKTGNSSYKKIAWNLILLRDHPDKLKGATLFFGPSLVQSGLCDSTLRKSGIRALNMATNGGGNEVELYFLEKSLKLHPKKVYLHLFKDQRQNLHPMTSLLYTPSALLSRGQSFNIPFIHYIFKRASYVVDYFSWKFFDGKEGPNVIRQYGVVYDNTILAEKTFNEVTETFAKESFESFRLEENNFVKSSEANRKGILFKLIRLRRKLLFNWSHSQFIYNVDSQDEFKKRAMALCEKESIPCAYLYMPYLTDSKIDGNFNHKFYRKQASIRIVSAANFKFLDDISCWADLTHLNRKGCIAFTKKLIEPLSK